MKRRLRKLISGVRVDTAASKPSLIISGEIIEPKV
jgi:hypothetical protein